MIKKNREVAKVGVVKEKKYNQCVLECTSENLVKIYCTGLRGRHQNEFVDVDMRRERCDIKNHIGNIIRSKRSKSIVHHLGALLIPFETHQ